MAHIGMSHGTPRNESWHTYEWVMAHIWTTWAMTHSYVCHDSFLHVPWLSQDTYLKTRVYKYKFSLEFRFRFRCRYFFEFFFSSWCRYFGHFFQTFLTFFWEFGCEGGEGGLVTVGWDSKSKHREAETFFLFFWRKREKEKGKRVQQKVLEREKEEEKER